MARVYRPANADDAGSDPFRGPTVADRDKPAEGYKAFAPPCGGRDRRATVRRRRAYSSRSAAGIGSRAARIAGNRPPTSPISSA